METKNQNHSERNYLERLIIECGVQDFIKIIIPKCGIGKDSYEMAGHIQFVKPDDNDYIFSPPYENYSYARTFLMGFCEAKKAFCK